MRPTANLRMTQYANQRSLRMSFSFREPKYTMSPIIEFSIPIQSSTPLPRGRRFIMRDELLAENWRRNTFASCGKIGRSETFSLSIFQIWYSSRNTQLFRSLNFPSWISKWLTWRDFRLRFPERLSFDFKNLLRLRISSRKLPIRLFYCLFASPADKNFPWRWHKYL